jgi:hypothetical protein
MKIDVARHNQIMEVVLLAERNMGTIIMLMDAGYELSEGEKTELGGLVTLTDFGKLILNWEAHRWGRFKQVLSKHKTRKLTPAMMSRAMQLLDESLGSDAVDLVRDILKNQKQPVMTNS